MTCKASGIDFVYCLMKKSRHKKVFEVGNSRMVSPVNAINAGDSFNEVVPMLLKYFADVSEYAKAHSLNDPKVPLIKLLVKFLTTQDVIKLLCQIKHFEIDVKGGIKKENDVVLFISS